MNILYIMFSFETGGIEKILLDIFNNHKKIYKNDKIFFCIVNDKIDMDLLKLINPEVTILLLKREEGSAKLKYIIKFVMYVLKNKINVIHCQAINGVKFSLLCKILRPSIKLVETINGKGSFLKYKKYEVLLDKIFVKKIIAISHCVENDILQRGIVRKKVELVYNGMDMDKFNIIKIQHEGINLGCVARIVPSIKGQDILIKAVSIVKKKYPHVRCYFAGETPRGEEKNLDDLINITHETETAENIIFTGNVIDIPEFLSNIDIFVLPSRREGFGVSLIEAMSAGIPVIASNIDGPKEIIKDKYGLLFESCDSNDLANKIICCIEKVNNYDRSLVLQYVKENYDIMNMIIKLHNIYEN